MPVKKNLDQGSQQKGSPPKSLDVEKIKEVIEKLANTAGVLLPFVLQFLSMFEKQTRMQAKKVQRPTFCAEDCSEELLKHLEDHLNQEQETVVKLFLQNCCALECLTSCQPPPEKPSDDSDGDENE